MHWRELLSSKAFLFSFAIIVAAIVFLHRLGDAYLGGDDTYYSEIAKEMAVTGDYLTPHHGYKVDFHTSKPPVLFWMNALSGKTFGFNSFAMRLPSAILGFLCVTALLFFVDRYFGFYTAFISALVLTFTQQYMYHARSAVTDGPFAAFFAFSLFSFWIARSEKKPVFYYLMGLFIGIAVMTRQIPGLFALCVIGAYIIFSKEYNILKNPHFYGGLVLSAFVFVPWHVIMYLKHGDGFINQYLRVTLMTGFKGYPADYSSNPSLNPWYAYAKILWENYWPWFPFLLAGIYKTAKNYRSMEKQTLFVILWAFVPLAIFQAAKVKQYHYIVPLYASFAIITATVFGAFKEPVKLRIAKILVLLVAGLAFSYILFPIVPRTLDSREFDDTMQMLPDVKSIQGEIYAMEKGFSHYASSFLFYGDKKITHVTDDEFVERVNSGLPGYFVVFKEKYDTIKDRLNTDKMRVIKETRDSFLFTH